MNVADIILLLVIVTFTWLGYKSGFINSFLGIVQWGGALLLAVTLYTPLTHLLNQYFLIEDEWQRPLSFSIVLLGGFIVLYVIIAALKKYVPGSIRYSFSNKITGLIPGFLTGIAVAIAMAKIMAASIWFATPQKEDKTFLLSSMVNNCEWLDEKVTPVFTAPATQKISGATESAYTSSEDFKSASFKPMPILEDQLLLMVNEERSKRGLKLLVADEQLQYAAYCHAADMFSRGYFSHNSPEGIDPFQRMKKLGINYTNAGENLAHSYNLDSAHNGLMNSPGHRDNILNSHFGKIGISILGSDTKGLMVVQEFSN